MTTTTDAACRLHVDRGNDLWHPPGHETQQQRDKRVRDARAICEECPLLEACKQAALDHPDKGGEGIWGGMTPNQRAQIHNTGKPKPNTGKPCPSWAAISRHHRSGEDVCEDCRAFRNDYQRERWHARKEAVA